MRKVLNAARDAGYRYDPLAAAIMSNLRKNTRRKFLGVIAALDLTEPERPNFAQAYQNALFEGATRRAAELGFKMERLSCPNSPSGLSWIDRVIQNRGIQGVLLLPVFNRPDFRHLDWSRYVGVYMDYMIEHPPLHAIGCDLYHGIINLLGRVRELGYQRPGIFVDNHASHRVHFRWEAGFMAYLSHHRELTQVPPLAVDHITEKVFKDWFIKYKPDLVIGHMDQAINWMVESGASIPTTHGFVACNISITTRPCAGFDLRPARLGEVGVEAIMAMIHRNERGTPTDATLTTIRPAWRNGPTITASIHPDQFWSRAHPAT